MSDRGPHTSGHGRNPGADHANIGSTSESAELALGQSPSPLSQDIVSPWRAVQKLPAPDWATVTEKTLSPQSAPHTDQEPTQSTFRTQHSSLSAPVTSQVSPAHNVDAALESATQPAPHWMVEQAARALQHNSLSAPVTSQVAPAHSVDAALESATQPAAHWIVEQAARATQLGCAVVACPDDASDAHTTVPLPLK